MSDTPQGPGWWQASDGRWYPPQPTPSPSPSGSPTAQSANPPFTGAPAGPPPSYGTPPPSSYMIPPQPPTSGTNGLAIASLVLGLVWLCGLGSLLAIVFGAVALSAMRKKPGQSGKGLAIAGIVLGVLGLAATVTTLALVSFGASEIHNNLGAPSERDDVTLLACDSDPVTQLPTASMSISNDSSKTSRYSINVEFRRGGRTVTGTDVLSITLGPGESQVTEIVASDTLPGEGSIDCDLGFVDRTAAES